MTQITLLELDSYHTKKLLLQLVIQSIRDYLSKDSDTYTCSNASFDTSKMFLFEPKYKLAIGRSKLSLEEILEIIVPESSIELMNRIQTLQDDGK